MAIAYFASPSLRHFHYWLIIFVHFRLFSVFHAMILRLHIYITSLMPLYVFIRYFTAAAAFAFQLKPFRCIFFRHWLRLSPPEAGHTLSAMPADTVFVIEFRRRRGFSTPAAAIAFAAADAATPAHFTLFRHISIISFISLSWLICVPGCRPPGH